MGFICIKLLYVVFATLSQIILTECNLNLDPRQNQLAHALRNILSPTNTEKAMQIIQMAANGQIGKPLPCIEEKVPPIPTAPIHRTPPTGLVPFSAAPIGAAPITAIQRPVQPSGHPYFLTRGSSDIPIDLHNLLELLSTNAIQKYNYNVPNYEMPNIPVVINTPREIIQVPSPNEIRCPCQETPAGNPFLPAASPVSAWTPSTSNSLPMPLPTQSRGHFLRKIPIPPPTL